ncbi:conjugal transfer protein TraA [Acidithiobacillus thiooxidans]|uniref:Conjugal transfer protein TraA n=2 Tax=Acidithiobacillus thiooxidans TaxID=930 RepID=A0A1C2J1X5_ACITH|nr:MULTISPECIES: hypothetical protein [Acidithiobacillus]MBU2740932.1 conjugal transfer protein TraA [Acidithiobacillus albertensis]MBU2792695.1 conjugal transfer protein TraA [Acidithiobacillus thiooxidans]MBU2811801.1 conjugal transfer protein TraA [Acidithiobacillus thiooxidans]MDX5933867.1 conjugal transfer protein TraA [Acidithiobacillus thiooxidans]OCX68823.1 conjugal transfer protein TraA [Acidithiobacillus thiooxidans]
MDAVMGKMVSRYDQMITRMDQMLSSKKVIATVVLLSVAIVMMAVQAHAGTGGTSFSAVATKIEGWAQGDLGLAIVAGGLIFGVATMVFTGKGTVLAIVVGGAVALYYGIPVLIKIFAASAGTVIAHTLIIHGLG